jgi:choline kinase
MKLLILAAGEGKRLRPLTKDRPKCMVEYKGKLIIEYILEVANELEVGIVDGYKKDILEKFLSTQNISFFTNENFAKTNMVATLFCAKEFMKGDLIISYADIVYNKEILKKVINFKGDFGVVVDRKWRELWSQRMDNPLNDAETLKIKDNKIVELGKKPKSYEDIEGQYIGLVKISERVLKKVINFYENLDKNRLYDSQDFNNMYMTSFIQLIIDNLLHVEPIFIDGGWVEIDSLDDLRVNMV